MGLQVNESMLDREVDEELKAEAKERGEDDWNVDETIARLEAVERRKRKELDSKGTDTAETRHAAEGVPRKDK